MAQKENDWRQRVDGLMREIDRLKSQVNNQQQPPPAHQRSNNLSNAPFQPRPPAETCTSITTMPNGKANAHQSSSRIRNHDLDLDLDLDINLNRANSMRARHLSRSGSEPLSSLDRKRAHTFPMSQGVSKTASRRHSFAAAGPSRGGATPTATHTATGSRPGTGTGTGTGMGTAPAPTSFHHSTQHADLSNRQIMHHRFHSTTPAAMNNRYSNQHNERRRYRSRDAIGMKRSKSMPYSRR